MRSSAATASPTAIAAPDHNIPRFSARAFAASACAATASANTDREADEEREPVDVHRLHDPEHEPDRERGAGRA